MIPNKKKLFQYYPDVDSLQVDLENIVQVTGYKNIKSFPYLSFLEKLYSELKDIISPQCAYVVIPTAKCNSKNGEVLINDIVLKTGKIITSSLNDISKAAFFIGTVGGDFDNWLEEKKKQEDPFVEYLASLIGSEFAESIAKWIHEKIEEQFAKDQLGCSNRYSPGYCGWDVNEQKKIFGFFPKDTCGITLMESSLMLPIKSVSGIVGIGEKVKWKDYLCDICNVQFCYKNRRSVLI